MPQRITVQMPVDYDKKLIVAASITQAAATLYVSGASVTEEEAITQHFDLYAEVVNRLKNADQI
ncbi:MAG: hypothetical protein LBS77_02520 [Desulfovibrio sp.]|jgi:hypothetical protein|nr:hypothetical protein [Desulfovibrio sp.]